MNQRASDTGRVASTREVDCWENEGGAEKNPAINSEVAEAMAKYGIARVPVD